MLTNSISAEKCIILVGMFITTLCCGILPLKLVDTQRSTRRWKALISYLSCFSGGVFVAACMLDLFPDVREAINNVLKEIEQRYQKKIEYPVAEFIIVIGFFLVLTIEQMVIQYGRSEANHIVATSNQDYGSISHQHNDLQVNSAEEQPLLQTNHDHSHLFNHTSLRSLMLLVALTFHSVFEGLAIGLQNDYSSLISLFMAIIVHKSVMAFALGLNLAQAGMRARTFMYALTLFSIASPIGMAIGIGLMDMKESLGRDIANGILQGISGGTFLYITFFEVLPKELDNEFNRMIKLGCVFLGYSCICILLIFA